MQGDIKDVKEPLLLIRQKGRHKKNQIKNKLKTKKNQYKMKI
jgi:hypothetical protein